MSAPLTPTERAAVEHAAVTLDWLGHSVTATCLRRESTGRAEALRWLSHAHWTLCGASATVLELCHRDLLDAEVSDHLDAAIHAGVMHL